MYSFQANRFVKSMGRDTANAPNGIDVVRQVCSICAVVFSRGHSLTPDAVGVQTDKKFLQALENGIRLGKWVLVENVSERIDKVLESLLLQHRFKQGGAEMIKIGDLVVPYNESFKCVHVLVAAVVAVVCT
jgi:dynein heavy chain